MRLLISSLFLITYLTIGGQVSSVEFGKNRVQYHDDFDNWWEYESENFITYWYGKGRNVAEAVVQTAELDFNEIQSTLEHRINDKVRVIVYVDLTDLKQSNIGLEETFENEYSKTKVVGNKMFVYFNGDHRHLRRQIREGVAAVYINSMLYGSNLQEIVQNAVLLNLPEWYSEGLIAFVGEQWNPETDQRLSSGKMAMTILIALRESTPGMQAIPCGIICTNNTAKPLYPIYFI